MLTAKQKAIYFIDSVFRFFDKIQCPYCGSNAHLLLDRKYFVTRLFECADCHLYYRHPLDRINVNKKFYQKAYVETDNITTSLPGPVQLKELVSGGFQKGNKSAVRYINLFKTLIPQKDNIKVIDYGCSWGYISAQLKDAGFDVESYEISKPRASFGNKNLDLNIKTSESELRDKNDIFFSSHVIEHLPSIKNMISLAKLKLNRPGLFIAVSPNGSRVFQEKHPKEFHAGWGKVHPNYLNVDFYSTIFKDAPFYIGSSPFNVSTIETTLGQDKQFVDDLSSEELIVVVKLL